MTRLVLELPTELAQELEAKRIDESSAKRIALAALTLSVQQGVHVVPPSTPDDAASFARQLIAQNRPLFEELARL